MGLIHGPQSVRVKSGSATDVFSVTFRRNDTTAVAVDGQQWDGSWGTKASAVP